MSIHNYIIIDEDTYFLNEKYEWVLLDPYETHIINNQSNIVVMPTNGGYIFQTSSPTANWYYDNTKNYPIKLNDNIKIDKNTIENI